VRARAASLGLVAALGFLLLVSLVISAILSRLSSYISAVLPFGALILQILNFVISFALISVLFAAIYKVLPDAKLSWADVLVGAVVTALLFNVGKFLIGLSEPQRGGFQLRRRRRADHRAAVDLLFGADFPAGCGIHQDLREPPRHSGRHPRRRLTPRVHVSFGYFSQDATIATTVAVIVAVASPPITCSGSGKVNPAMTDGRVVRRIIITLTGTATTPFSTALQ
jgi:virulence factor BrkB